MSAKDVLEALRQLGEAESDLNAGDRVAYHSWSGDSRSEGTIRTVVRALRDGVVDEHYEVEWDLGVGPSHYRYNRNELARRGSNHGQG